MMPLQTLYFQIEIDHLQIATFQECDGLNAYRHYDYFYEGGNNSAPYAIPGPVFYDTIKLRKGIIHNINFWEWFMSMPEHSSMRKNGSIVLCKPNGEEARRWNFFNAFPVRWAGPRFDALKDELAVEEIELVHEGLVLVEHA
jgi:phage tail-like protein